MGLDPKNGFESNKKKSNKNPIKRNPINNLLKLSNGSLNCNAFVILCRGCQT
jgi:hypothetical protein